jgi:3-oxoacyl-[acyl-carrier-protein] synthase-3
MAVRPVVLDRVRIASTGSYLPARRLTNAEIVASGVDTTCSWIEENLGVEERRIADDGELTSDLATAAGLAAIRNARIEPNDIDAVIVATATPDRMNPSTACIAQAKMGIRNRGPAFDISAVCSGFLYAMVVGGQFVNNGVYDRVLVIGADTFSKITDWTRRDCVFFGDGAGAVVLERTAAGFFSSLLRADGAGADNFTVHRGHQHYTMNARAVYETATTALPEAIDDLLRLHGRDISEVKAIIPHQPSARVLRKTAEALGATNGALRTNLRHHANTAGATVPLLLDQVNAAGGLQPNDLVLFAAVGAGWTWGAALYEWN